MKRNALMFFIISLAGCASLVQNNVRPNAGLPKYAPGNRPETTVVINVADESSTETEADTALTEAEQEALAREEAILKEIIELYAAKALDRPQDIGVCVREMFAMNPSGKCRDRFTHYVPPEDAKTIREDLDGEFGGIGAELTVQDNAIVVVAPLPGTPAEKAGLKPGDVITKVNDKDVTKLFHAVQAIRGKVGTTVKITIVRKNVPQPIDFILTREKIVVVSVESRVISRRDHIGLIRVNRFQDHTAADFIKALESLREQNVDRVVIDLRNNPGGLLGAVVNMLGLFMKPNDTMLTIRERDKTRGIGATRTDLLGRNFRSMKVIVLINGGSASASEIFAGTMKDWGYQIVGEKSFGKGVGQNVFELSDGSLLTLTTFEFLVGNHRVAIRDKGVTPTVEVIQPDEPRMPGKKSRPNSRKKDPQLEKAVELLRAM